MQGPNRITFLLAIILLIWGKRLEGQNKFNYPQDYIVKLNHAQSEAAFVKVRRTHPPTKEEIRSLPEFQNLAQQPSIEAIEPDYTFLIETLPNDPAFTQQWGLAYQGQIPGIAQSDIAATDAWDLRTTTQIVAGIIDTGIDYGHVDLKENIWQNLAEDADGDGTVLEWDGSRWVLDPGDLDGIDADNNGYIDDLVGWDFVNNDNNPFDDNGHGTHVAGILGAKGDNNVGISGLAWEVPMMALKAFDRRGAGSLSSILPAMMYARQMGAGLINNSWGGPAFSRFLKEEIELAAQAEIWCIAAAGNYGNQAFFPKMYPASYNLDNIISVGASDAYGKLANYSNYHATAVDLVAPGSLIYSTLPNGQYGFKSGTSMATPLVSATILLMSEQFPSLSLIELKNKLLASCQTGQTLKGKCTSGGRLNVFQALTANNTLTAGAVLEAEFNGTWVGCLNQTLTYTNTSQSPNLANTTFKWEIDGQFVSNSLDLQYSFANAGIFEVKLIARQGSNTSTLSKTVQIQGIPQLMLGADTTICAAAYLLEAGVGDFQYRWKRIISSNQSGQTSTIPKLGISDSILFRTQGGNYQGYVGKFVLTDIQNKIIKISDHTAFPPQDSAGQYYIFSVYYDQFPTALIVGNNLTQAVTSAQGCIDISAPFELHVLETEELGTDPWQVIRQSGTYIVEAEDYCGNKVQDTITITLIDGCVWPGDVNTDGVVNLVDFLFLGVANEATGLSRDSVSAIWESKTSPDWPQSFSADAILAPSVNFKHADCNGDGVVDMQADSAVISQNLGFLHQIPQPIDSQGYSFWVEHLNTYFISSDTAVVELGLMLEGPAGTDISGLYGMATNLYFSEQLSQAPHFSPDTTNWMSPVGFMAAFPDGGQQTAGAQYLQGNRKMAGIAMVGRDRKPFMGRALAGGGVGVVIVVDDLAEDPNLLGYTPLTITTEDIILIDTKGEYLKQNQGTAQNSITVNIDWPDFSNTFPVEWLSFEVDQRGSDALLQWETAMEVNTDYFEVQRSIDGKLFGRIGQIKAAGSSQTMKSYQFEDKNIAVQSFSKVYYRLRQIDQNGQYTYSETISLQIGKPALFLLAFPNPASTQLNVRYASPKQNGLSLKVTNSLGQEIYHQVLPDMRGAIEVPVHQWATGVYYLVLENEQQRIVYKWIREP